MWCKWHTKIFESFNPILHEIAHFQGLTKKLELYGGLWLHLWRDRRAGDMDSFTERQAFNCEIETIKHLFPHSNHNLLVNVEEVGHFLSLAWITHCFLRVPWSPRIPWLSLPGRTMASQCSCPEIVYSSLMENIFASSRCLSQSELDPHHDCKWKGPARPGAATPLGSSQVSPWWRGMVWSKNKTKNHNK